MKGRFAFSYVLTLCLVLTLLVALPWMASAQVVEEWVARYNGPGNGTDHAFAIAVDSSGNIYVTGESSDIGPNADYTTIKYDSEGNEEWVVRYNGPENGRDLASAIAVDSAGNVYVTGESSGSGIGCDYATVKYDSNGNEQWVVRYNGPANAYDSAFAIAVDSLGNVYVTGYSTGFGTLYDYATVKYDSNGNEQWVARYAGPGEDRALGLAVDSSGNVYVTGYSTGSGTDYDYATVKYDTNGSQKWVERYNGPGNGKDHANAIAIDPLGNIYVTGYSTGIGTDYDYATVKYDTNGGQQGLARYNGPGNGKDHATAITIDSLGNVYVTGYSTGIGTYYDYATVKYDTNVFPQWTARYNGPKNNGDGAYAIVVDTCGNVYVTGESQGSGTGLDYATLKYDINGNQVWVERYNGPGNGDDSASAIAIDPLGNIYVTGYSAGSGTDLDYATVRYTDQYSEKEVFLISDEVWRNVLSLVPLTTWTDNDGIIHKYPTLIYHREVTGFDADSIIYFLQQYSPTHLTIVGDTPQELDNLLIAAPQLGAGLAEAQISKITMNDYFSYWPEREVFVVAEDDYETGLMASVFASYIHVPLLFEGHFDNDVINTKKVYIIGNLSNQQAIINIADVLQIYSLTDLQERYVELTGTDKIILVNPDDLNINVNENFHPEKSAGSISKLYSKTSLIAPFLAGAKHEVIINSPSSNYTEVDEFIENSVSALAINAAYLTIVASPDAISMYDSYYKEPDFRVYADLDDNLEKQSELAVGRIMGISISDGSSLLARTLFYNDIKPDTTGFLMIQRGDPRVDISGSLYQRIPQLQCGTNFCKCYFDVECPDIFNGYIPYFDSYKVCNESYGVPPPPECDTRRDELVDFLYSSTFAMYGDHGAPNGWVFDPYPSNMLSSSDLEYLPPLFGYSFACSTCAYISEKSNLFCTNMIRKGAIGYIGAVSTMYGHHFLDEFLEEALVNEKSIGEAFKTGKNKERIGDWGTPSTTPIEMYGVHDVLIGDPTFNGGNLK